MTTGDTVTDEIVHLLGGLTDAEVAAFVEGLSPADAEALSLLLPADPQALARAQAEAADGIAWLRTIAPEMFPLTPGPQHHTLAGLLPTDGPRGTRAVVGAFRGAGKSTLATTGLPLLAGVRRSHRFCVILRETLPEAVSAVRGLRSFLEERPALTQRYPWITPLPGEMGEIRMAGGMHIVARGAHGAIRGLQRTVGGAVIRPDMVIADDVYGDEAARSTLQTDRLVEWLLGTVGGLAGPAGQGGRAPMDVILIGTTLERGDLVSRMLDGVGPFASWRRARFPAYGTVTTYDEARYESGVYGAPDGPLCVVDTEGAVTSIPVPEGATPGDVAPAWPAGAPLSYLHTLTDPKSETFVGSRVFAREFLLRPRTAEDSLFSDEHTVWVDHLRARVQDATIHVTRAAEGVDPSTGEGDDFSAIVVTALARLGDVLPDVDADVADRDCIVVLHAERDRWTLAQLLTRVEQVAEGWTEQGIRVAFEAAGGFKWGAQELKRRRRVASRAVVVATSKYERSLPLSVWHEAGRVLVDAGLRGTAWDAEFHSFTGTDKDEHDDLVDATVHAATYTTSAWRRTAA